MTQDMESLEAKIDAANTELEALNEEGAALECELDCLPGWKVRRRRALRARLSEINRRRDTLCLRLDSYWYVYNSRNPGVVVGYIPGAISGLGFGGLGLGADGYRP